MEKKKLRIVFYARVATGDQCDDAVLKAQSEYIREYAERKGMEVVGGVHAVELGTTMDRPGWHDTLLLADRENADAVCTKNISRVARGADMIEQAISDLDQHDLGLITCEPFDSRQHLSILHQILADTEQKT